MEYMKNMAFGVEKSYREEARGNSLVFKTPLYSSLTTVRYGQCIQEGTPTPQSPITITGKAAGVSVYGKNLLHNILSTQTKNGIAFTTQDDGSVLVVGTATAKTEIPITDLLVLTDGTYTLSGCPSGGGGSTYYLRTWVNNASTPKGDDMGLSKTFNFVSATDVNMKFYIVVANGATLNQTFKPQLELGSAATAFEPYKTAQTQTVKDSNNNDVTLYGIPVASGGNVIIGSQQYISDTLEGTTLTRRIGAVDLGTLTYTKGGATYYSRNNNQKAASNGKCSSYGVLAGAYGTSLSNNQMATSPSDDNVLYFKDDIAFAAMTAAQFKTYLSGVMFYFELATPTTETVTLSPETLNVNAPVTAWLSEAYSHVTYVRETADAINELAEAIVALGGTL